jgi:hypothetical protein
MFSSSKEVKKVNDIPTTTGNRSKPRSTTRPLLDSCLPRIFSRPSNARHGLFEIGQ